MLEIIVQVIAFATALGIFSALIAKYIPNDKLYAWGVQSGEFLNSLGTSKIGSSAWEKLEDFLVNSVGEYLRGMKDGLDANEKKNDG